MGDFQDRYTLAKLNQGLFSPILSKEIEAVIKNFPTKMKQTNENPKQKSKTNKQNPQGQLVFLQNSTRLSKES